MQVISTNHIADTFILAIDMSLLTYLVGIQHIETNLVTNFVSTYVYICAHLYLHVEVTKYFCNLSTSTFRRKH